MQTGDYVIFLQEINDTFVAEDLELINSSFIRLNIVALASAW